MDKKLQEESKREQEEIEKVIQEFQPYKQVLLDKLINRLLIYVRGDIMPKSEPSAFMECYNIIYEQALLQFNNRPGKRITCPVRSPASLLSPF